MFPLSRTLSSVSWFQSTVPASRMTCSIRGCSGRTRLRMIRAAAALAARFRKIS
jgi:hypothetical protein